MYMKKFKIIFSLAVILVFLSSCKKDEPISCEESKNADLFISNISQDPYDIYIDNNLIYRLHGGMITMGLTITEGERELKAIQVSGFEDEPLEIVNPIDVLRCEEYTWQIPL